MVVTLLQWLGAVIAVVGYVFFLNDRKFIGAWLTVIAAILLATWSAIMGMGGMLFLNFVILGINAVSIARTLWHHK